MATYAEVKKFMDDIATKINVERSAYEKAKARIEAVSSNLAGIPTIYEDLITTVDAYTPTGSFETLCKDEKNKLSAEFTALKNIVDALIATTEFTA